MMRIKYRKMDDFDIQIRAINKQIRTIDKQIKAITPTEETKISVNILYGGLKGEMGCQK
ncbi:MAG: hypothetical protein MUO82_04590 [Candidatus Thermoplasmatota archaeon]|nr:hypothetical protein [Candidatus Thermoplasmatota archaeon]